MGRSRGGPYRSGRRLYVDVFLSTAGPGPWPCGHCKQPVPEIKVNVGVVHHKDGDETNADPVNLEAMHWGCHVKHHLTGRAPGPLAMARAAVARRRTSQQQRIDIRVRHRAGETQDALAVEYGVAQSTISRIIKET